MPRQLGPVQRMIRPGGPTGPSIGRALGRFGDPLTVDQQGQISGLMDQTLASLNQAIDDLAAKASSAGSSWNPFGPDAEGGAATLSALNTLRTVTQRLATSSKVDVLSGAEDFSKWKDAAQTVMDGVTAQAQLLSEEGPVSNWVAAAKQSIDQIGQIIGTVATGIANHWQLGGIVLLGVVGFFLWHYLSPPSVHVSTAEYRGRRGGKKRSKGRARALREKPWNTDDNDPNQRVI